MCVCVCVCVCVCCSVALANNKNNMRVDDGQNVVTSAYSNDKGAQSTTSRAEQR